MYALDDSDGFTNFKNLLELQCWNFNGYRYFVVSYQCCKTLFIQAFYFSHAALELTFKNSTKISGLNSQSCVIANGPQQRLVRQHVPFV